MLFPTRRDVLRSERVCYMLPAYVNGLGSVWAISNHTSGMYFLRAIFMSSQNQYAWVRIVVKVISLI